MKRWSAVGERQLAPTGNTTVFRSYGARSHRGIGLAFRFEKDSYSYTSSYGKPT